MIRFEGVGVSLVDRPILSDINLSLGAGELLVVKGGVGSGKSTFLNFMKGRLMFSGHVKLFGQVCYKSDDIKKMNSRMSFLDQQPTCMKGVSALKHIQMSLWAKGGLRLSGTGSFLQSILYRLDLMAIAHRPMECLSMQEKMRVFLARCLVVNPEMLFLDDPVFVNDSSYLGSFESLIESLLDEGRVVVLTSHKTPKIRQGCQVLKLVNRSYGF